MSWNKNWVENSWRRNNLFRALASLFYWRQRFSLKIWKILKFLRASRLQKICLFEDFLLLCLFDRLKQFVWIKWDCIVQIWFRLSFLVILCFRLRVQSKSKSSYFALICFFELIVLHDRKISAVWSILKLLYFKVQASRRNS